MNNNIYMQNILDHYHNPENFGNLESATHSSLEHNPLCGDKIEVFLEIKNYKIENIGFTGEGCAISQAAMSILSSELIGMTIVEVESLTKEDIVDLLGIDLSPTRLKCALLSLQAVHNALNAPIIK